MVGAAAMEVVMEVEFWVVVETTEDLEAMEVMGVKKVNCTSTLLLWGGLQRSCCTNYEMNIVSTENVHCFQSSHSKQNLTKGYFE